MYLSRYHFQNSKISLSIDSLSGELLELINLSTGDNIIKAHDYFYTAPFCLAVDGGRKITVPKRTDCVAHPELSAKIETCIEPDGQLITVSYDHLLANDGNIFNLELVYSIRLRADKSVLEMNIDIANSEIALSSCLFPYISGIWLGESYSDDILLYPKHAGIKLENPTKALSIPPNQINWRWQDYKYVYNVTGVGLHRDDNGYYSLENLPVSMLYTDLYDSENGFYFGGYPQDHDIMSIVVQTKGELSAGVNFGLRHYIPEMKDCLHFRGEIMLHSGNWHEAAEHYRNISAPAVSCMESNRPEWFEKSAGLVAHYDFKYQNGGVVHKFSDIPRLADEALELGLDHMLFAGWHKDGFDNGFPQYYVDNEVGTIEELKNGIEQVHKKGIKVSFYINSRLANTKYEANTDIIDQGAVKMKDGNLYIEQYGNDSLKFATMCPSAPVWKEHINNAFSYIKAAGADGVYFDQIAMASPLFCHSNEHNHTQPDEWFLGCRQLIALAKRNDLSIIIEGCSDIYGSAVSGQLVSTFSYIDNAYPEFYKYTFPSHTLVDMAYPKKNLAMRPVFIGYMAKDIIDTALLTDMYFWVYDLIDDNTFFRDPEMKAYLTGALTIKKKLIALKGKKTFTDTKYLIDICGKKASALELDCDPNADLVVLTADCHSVTVLGSYACIHASAVDSSGNIFESISECCCTLLPDGNTKLTVKYTLGMFILKKID